VFHDEEKKVIGLQPSETGYKLNTNNRQFRIKCMPLTRIAIGEFDAEWDEKKKMLIFGYNNG